MWRSNKTQKKKNPKHIHLIYIIKKILDEGGVQNKSHHKRGLFCVKDTNFESKPLLDRRLHWFGLDSSKDFQHHTAIP